MRGAAVVIKLRRLWQEETVWGSRRRNYGLGLEYFMGGRLSLVPLARLEARVPVEGYRRRRPLRANDLAELGLLAVPCHQACSGVYRTFARDEGRLGGGYPDVSAAVSRYGGSLERSRWARYPSTFLYFFAQGCG